VNDVTTYDMSLFLGIIERGGMPVGLRDQYVLLRMTKEKNPSAKDEI